MGHKQNNVTSVLRPRGFGRMADMPKPQIAKRCWLTGFGVCLMHYLGKTLSSCRIRCSPYFLEAVFCYVCTYKDII